MNQKNGIYRSSVKNKKNTFFEKRVKKKNKKTLKS